MKKKIKLISLAIGFRGDSQPKPSVNCCACSVLIKVKISGKKSQETLRASIFLIEKI